jgi:hypothetical protein
MKFFEFAWVYLEGYLPVAETQNLYTVEVQLKKFPASDIQYDIRVTDIVGRKRKKSTKYVQSSKKKKEKKRGKRKERKPTNYMYIYYIGP